MSNCCRASMPLQWKSAHLPSHCFHICFLSYICFMFYVCIHICFMFVFIFDLSFDFIFVLYNTSILVGGPNKFILPCLCLTSYDCVRWILLKSVFLEKYSSGQGKKYHMFVFQEGRHLTHTYNHHRYYHTVFPDIM